LASRGCYLAGELLDLAERHGSLAELQAAALVPLELVLHRELACWRPGTWVATVMAALPDHRQMRR
jgi:hypothetical protein